MYTKALEWQNEGRSVALAMVIANRGSSPRAVGSQVVIDDNGIFEGSVSGGCLEGVVITEALETMKTGIPKRLFFGVTKENGWEVGLACGGEVEVVVEKAPSVAILRDLAALRQGCSGVCVITNLASGIKTLAKMDACESHETLAPWLRDGVAQVRANERSLLLEKDGASHFFHGLFAPLQLVIVGAVHIAQPLARMALMTGYQVTIIDPRETFGAKERFPDVDIVVAWPDEALQEMNIHSRTALVALTHDPKLDDPALGEALKSEAFYVGALGSRKTHAARRERLEQAGFSKETIDRIHGPVGLPIGAVTPEEIALSVMAQITEKHRLR